MSFDMYVYELMLHKYLKMELLGHRECMCSASSVQSLSRVRLCNPMDCSTPGFPVNHQLPELPQTQVFFESVMPSNLSPFCFESSQCQRLVFSNESVLRISPSNEYSGFISFRIDWVDLLVVQRTLKGSSQISQFLASGGQSIGVSASASVLLMNIQD